jgi:hypothetical protein
MVAQSISAVVDAALEKAKGSNAAPYAAVCMQAACIRALALEVESYPPTLGVVDSLQQQLVEEIDRLLSLVRTD